MPFCYKSVIWWETIHILDDLTLELETFWYRFLDYPMFLEWKEYLELRKIYKGIIQPDDIQGTGYVANANSLLP